MISEPSGSTDSPALGIVLRLLFAVFGAGAAAIVYVAVLTYCRVHQSGFWPIMAATVIFTGSVIAIALSTAFVGHKPEGGAPSAPIKRYAFRYCAAMGLYVVALVA